MTTINRRKFLETSAVGGAALSVGVGAAGCGNDVEPAPQAKVTIDDEPLSPTYGVITVPVAMYPQLNKVGGAVTLHVEDPGSNPEDRAYVLPEGHRILLIQHVADSFAAFQSSCPHAGCPLGYSVKDEQIECPCHSSRFRVIADAGDLKKCAGSVLHAPARAGLQSWTTTLDSARGVVTIDLKSVLSCNKAFPAIMNNVITLPLVDFPQLAMAGGAVTGQPTGVRDPIIVVRIDETTVAALDARCTHRGCSVEYEPNKRELDCPCHGSTFQLDGSVSNGPAVFPLDVYTAQLTADSVIVTLA
jgi:cytochrome b6-f complex iron-sulfur subunit